ncbi:ATP-binding cassette domain-containing protein [Maribacter sp. ACAM166]|uniref:ATP-binding cassette domain-containing protein n=1 Tax=Maribacter sp. ACAM166 TaxID=2508996 RepID=UPI0010FEA4F6|nr:ATP-binding cassette domain-containing protein [Maribacter sp. ACAM166]TLP77030.1 ATP-binding cassette domain-containing protein [Maribacter sp. ACAM166]
MNHWVIYIDNNSKKKEFIELFSKGKVPTELQEYKDKTGSLYSQITLEKLIEEEDKHDHKIISSKEQALETMSSGEQKKALLYYLLQQRPDYIILDNPFDNLDTHFQEELKTILQEHSTSITFIQLASRKADTLLFINKFGKLDHSTFTEISNLKTLEAKTTDPFNTDSIPTPLATIGYCNNPLIQFKNVSISHGNKTILRDINWKVNKGDFWQLTGANGTGKTSILSMIIGDNPKAFGQEIYLFGSKKGSGESVWDIKKKVGYYSPAMTNRFKGRHSVEHMLISGLTDSVGLYTMPTEMQKRLIKQWLLLLDLYELKDTYFNQLSTGKQRLIMTARAMVKHPPVLILDEPTTGMDDASAALLVALVNKIAKETDTAIIFVSHRKEPYLEPKSIYTLLKSATGSIGVSTTA